MPTAEQMDHWLWNLGYGHWLADPYSSSKVPHELDYLHALQGAPALRTLARWLSDSIKAPIRLTAMWQDKHAYVRPVNASGRALADRELADIAIIVQRTTGGILSRSMWILQAKICAKADSRFTGPSSAKEILLLEGEPAFSLIDRPGGTKYGPLFAANSFHGPGHWSFLTFRKNHTGGTVRTHLNPVRERWPGSKTSATVSHQSFCQALLAALRGTYGRPVNTPALDPWSKLFEQLIRLATHKPSSGHAKSRDNPKGLVLQFATTYPLMIGMVEPTTRFAEGLMSHLSFRSIDFDWDEHHGIASGDSEANAEAWDRFNNLLIEDAWEPNSRLDEMLSGGPPTPPRRDGDGAGPSGEGGFPLMLFVDVGQG